ncbi:MAG: nucleotidyltransferase domain-containing protein [Cytophagaceae bacterium]|nr:MAG: nucleotidyltransferase domain-containing protein [Cytophagaceae bacterium]
MNLTYTPHALSSEQLQALSQELKQALSALYGHRLDRLILYGSYARGDFHAESDVDYLVVLRDEPVQEGNEVWVMADNLSYLSDKYDVLVLVKPTSVVKYAHSNLFFYEEVRREGIDV